jgi:hypothetical protein
VEVAVEEVKQLAMMDEASERVITAEASAVGSGTATKEVEGPVSTVRKGDPTTIHDAHAWRARGRVERTPLVAQTTKRRKKNMRCEMSHLPSSVGRGKEARKQRG